jgi:hypothetical protein
VRASSSSTVAENVPLQLGVQRPCEGRRSLIGHTATCHDQRSTGGKRFDPTLPPSVGDVVAESEGAIRPQAVHSMLGAGDWARRQWALPRGIGGPIGRPAGVRTRSAKPTLPCRGRRRACGCPPIGTRQLHQQHWLPRRRKAQAAHSFGTVAMNWREHPATTQFCQAMVSLQKKIDQATSNNERV